MKKILIYSVALAIMLGNLTCNAQSNKTPEAKNSVSNKVEVYYFHFTRRWNTCISVEENEKLAVETLYPEKVKTGEYTFKAMNLDDSGSKAIAEKLGIGGQTLIVVHDKNKIDITDKGFLNAHDLVKMKEEIKKAIEQVL